MPRLLICVTVVAAFAAGAEVRHDDKKPLVLESQGSYFVGGETKTISTPGPNGTPADSDITVNQMYVQYQVPPGAIGTHQ